MISSETQVKSRDSYIDIAKGIGILMVVLGHTYGIPARLYDVIYSFHMPLFFIISGYVYNNQKYKNLSFRQMVTNRAKRYLLPYYLFAGINLVLSLGFDFIFKHQPITFDKIKTYFLGTLYCYADMDHMPNCSPIWFFMTLFIGGIIFWAIMKYSQKTQPIWAGACLIISYVLYIFIDFRLPLNLAPTGAAVFFMYVGYLIKRYNIMKYIGLISLFVIGLIASYLNEVNVGMNENCYGNLLFFLVAALCLSLSVLILCKVCSKFNNPINKFLNWLGSNTILIVAFNYFMRDFSTEIYYLTPVIKNYKIHWSVSFIYTLSGCIVLVLSWNFIKSRFKKHKDLSTEV